MPFWKIGGLDGLPTGSADGTLAKDGHDNRVANAMTTAKMWSGAPSATSGPVGGGRGWARDTFGGGPIGKEREWETVGDGGKRWVERRRQGRQMSCGTARRKQTDVPGIAVKHSWAT